MKLKISNMTGKLKDIQAINTNTLSNAFCKKENQSNNPDKICTICYSFYMLETFRKSCVDAWENNSMLLSTTKFEWHDIVKLRFKNDIVRIHGHGELINSLHLQNICKICQHFCDKTFAIWSKRIDLVRKFFKDYPIPSNLILIYSNPKIDHVLSTPPRPFHKVFNNVSDTHPLENCTGQKCNDCRLCYSFKKEKIIVENTKNYVKRDTSIN